MNILPKWFNIYLYYLNLVVLWSGETRESFSLDYINKRKGSLTYH
jgi:hypothetical protein